MRLTDGAWPYQGYDQWHDHIIPFAWILEFIRKISMLHDQSGEPSDVITPQEHHHLSASGQNPDDWKKIARIEAGNSVAKVRFAALPFEIETSGPPAPPLREGARMMADRAFDLHAQPSHIVLRMSGMGGSNAGLALGKVEIEVPGALAYRACGESLLLHGRDRNHLAIIAGTEDLVSL